MKVNLSVLFTVLMISSAYMQAADQKVVAQETDAQAQVVKTDAEQPVVTDSIGWAMAAGAGVGTAVGIIDNLFTLILQPKSAAGIALWCGASFVLPIAALEMVRAYVEQNQKMRLHRFFLYSSFFTMRTVAALVIRPSNFKVSYDNWGNPSVAFASSSSVIASRAIPTAPAVSSAAPAILPVVKK